LVNHAVHLTDEEIKILAKNDVRLTYNPLSNMRLAAGVMRLPTLHAAGVKVGFGLDGGTNDTSDMFANMRAAVGLQRATTLRPDIFPTVVDALIMATLGGAEVLDMADRIGSLTPGKKADLIILNPSNINFAPRWDWISQIVFNGQPANVEYVFVDGRPLMAKGQLLGVSRTVIVHAAEDSARRIKEAIQKK
jgi:5-methylthioadenosine/S-adenosylhomocysteine deaminase